MLAAVKAEAAAELQRERERCLTEYKKELQQQQEVELEKARAEARQMMQKEMEAGRQQEEAKKQREAQKLREEAIARDEARAGMLATPSLTVELWGIQINVPYEDLLLREQRRAARRELRPEQVVKDLAEREKTPLPPSDPNALKAPRDLRRLFSTGGNTQASGSAVEKDVKDYMKHLQDPNSRPAAKIAKPASNLINDVNNYVNKIRAGEDAAPILTAAPLAAANASRSDQISSRTLNPRPTGNESGRRTSVRKSVSKRVGSKPKD